MAADKIIPFTQDDYEIVNREVPYQGMFRLAVYQLRYRLYSGEWSNTISRESWSANRPLAYCL